MGTFKVIEEGRMLSKEELDQISGGLCISDSIYRKCDENGKTTCIGFVLCAVEFNCTGFFRTCGVDGNKFTCTDTVYNMVFEDELEK